MTQLFDTTTYDHLDEVGDEPARHLRSIPVGATRQNGDVGSRSTQWRLDSNTIEIGRKGIQAARQALQDAARDKANDTAKPTRRAA